MAVQYTKFVKNFKFTNIYSLNRYQRYLLLIIIVYYLCKFKKIYKNWQNFSNMHLFSLDP